MTRNLITELVIRLLAIWLIITSIRHLIPSIVNINKFDVQGTEKIVIYLLYFLSIIITFGISVLMIKYSERIVKIIWVGRKNEDDIIIENDRKEILPALISIVGIYFVISSLSKIIAVFSKYLIITPEYYYAKESIKYLIGDLSYDIILLIFGIILFAIPEKLIPIKNDIKNILTRDQFKNEDKEK